MNYHGSAVLKCIMYAAVPLFGMLFAGLVLAERADRDKPIHIEADRATVEELHDQEDAKQISILTGNVKLTQGTLVVRAEKVVMKENNDGFRFITALGDLVSFRQKREGVDEYVEAWAKRVKFDDKSDKIELFKEARLKRGQDEVEGDYISYDMKTEFFQVTGGKEQGFESDADNRVKVVIQPKSKQAAVEQDE